MDGLPLPVRVMLYTASLAPLDRRGVLCWRPPADGSRCLCQFPRALGDLYALYYYAVPLWLVARGFYTAYAITSDVLQFGGLLLPLHWRVRLAGGACIAASAADPAPMTPALHRAADERPFVRAAWRGECVGGAGHPPSLRRRWRARKSAPRAH